MFDIPSLTLKSRLSQKSFVWVLRAFEIALPKKKNLELDLRASLFKIVMNRNRKEISCAFILDFLR